MAGFLDFAECSPAETSGAAGFQRIQYVVRLGSGPLRRLVAIEPGLDLADRLIRQSLAHQVGTGRSPAISFTISAATTIPPPTSAAWLGRSPMNNQTDSVPNTISRMESNPISAEAR
jgi:hypothetical protein